MTDWDYIYANKDLPSQMSEMERLGDEKISGAISCVLIFLVFMALGMACLL